MILLIDPSSLSNMLRIHGMQVLTRQCITLQHIIINSHHCQSHHYQISSFALPQKYIHTSQQINYQASYISHHNHYQSSSTSFHNKEVKITS